MGNVHAIGAGSVTSINGVSGAVQIGGRNLFAGTKDFSEHSGHSWIYKNQWSMDGEYNGFTVYSRTGAWSGLTQQIPVKAGDVFTLSAFIKIESGGEVRCLGRNQDEKGTGINHEIVKR